MAAPLFLLAPPRSFTSVINAMLGQHPQMFGLPELNIFNSGTMLDLWHTEDEYAVDAKLRHGLLRAIAEIYMGEQTDETIEAAEHWCAARETMRTGDVFLEIAARLHPLIPVEKSPAYTIEPERMDYILKTCPDARFIHLTRHPVKQCESTMELNNGEFPLFVNSIEYGESAAIIEPQIAWHDINVGILDFLENNVARERYMRIRGEDFFADPQAMLGTICRWLGIRDDAQALEDMMHPERSPFARLGPVGALFGNDPKFLKGPWFRPHKPKMPPLDQPVSWRQDGKGLYPEVVALAHEFGY